MQTLTPPHYGRLPTAHCSLVTVQHCTSAINPLPTVHCLMSARPVLFLTSCSPPLPPLHCLVNIYHPLSSAKFSALPTLPVHHSQCTTKVSYPPFTMHCQGFSPLSLSLCMVQPRPLSPSTVFSVTHCLSPSVCHSLSTTLCLLSVVHHSCMTPVVHCLLPTAHRPLPTPSIDFSYHPPSITYSLHHFGANWGIRLWFA